jgi:hypothetical protein
MKKGATMTKYSALWDYLRSQHEPEVPMTFSEIERVIGCKLPKSQRYPAWWSNNTSNNVMTKVWLAAGYRTEHVDIVGRKLVFKRVAAPAAPPAATPPAELAEEASAFRPAVHPAAREGRHPLLGVLKGLLKAAPSDDLTAPALPDWERTFDKKWAEKRN